MHVGWGDNIATSKIDSQIEESTRDTHVQYNLDALYNRKLKNDDNEC